MTSINKLFNSKNILNDLKIIDNWCISAANKAPLVVNQDGTLRNASIHEESFLTFQDACALALKHKTTIGFVLKCDDEFTCIDLDVKDAHSLDKEGNPVDPSEWTTREQLDRYESIVSSVDSYTEISQSGKGVHIWVKARLDKGYRRDGVEIYSHERYIISTGNSVRRIKYDIGPDNVVTVGAFGDPVGISDRQDFVSQMTSQMESASGARVVQLEEIEEEYTDGTLMQIAQAASNSEKFNNLCNLPYLQLKELYGYPSQSEADLALMSIFAFYSSSNEQCRRIFRYCELGQREKATKDDRYLNLTLRKSRANQLDENDRAAHSEELAKNILSESESEVVMESSVVVERAPGKFEIDWNNYTVKDVRTPPGFLGVMAWISKNASFIPQLPVAIIAVIALIAGVCGRYYRTPTGADLSLYLLLVGHSGLGKDPIHKVTHQFIKVTNMPDAKRYILHDRCASGAAYHKMMIENPGAVCLRGEVGADFIEMSNRRNTNIKELQSIMLDSYSSEELGGRRYSNAENSLSGVASPAMSFLGETTEKIFFHALTADMMSSGFMSRFTTFLLTGERPKSNKENTFHMEKNHLTYWQGLVAESLKLHRQFEQGNTNPRRIPFESDVVAQVSDEFEEFCRIKFNYTNDDGISYIWSRAHLKVLKLSGVVAVADNYINPKITLEHLTWACKMELINAKIYFDQHNAGNIGSGDDTRLRKFKDVTRKYLQQKYSLSGKDQVLCQKGIITYSFYLTAANVSAFTNHPYGQKRSVEDTIGSLISCGILEEVKKDSQAEFSGRGKRCYRIADREELFKD